MTTGTAMEEITLRLPVSHRISLVVLVGFSVVLAVPFCYVLTLNALVAILGCIVSGVATVVANWYMLYQVKLVITKEKIAFTNWSFTIEAAWQDVVGVGEVKGWSRPTEGLRLRSYRLVPATGLIRFLDSQTVFYSMTPVGIALAPFSVGPWRHSELGHIIARCVPGVFDRGSSN